MRSPLPSTLTTRAKFKEEIELEKRKIFAKIELMKELKDMGIDPSILENEQQQGSGKGAGGQHAGGRPPSAQKAPKLAQKGKAGGAPRTIVKES